MWIALLMGLANAQGMSFCTEDWTPVCCQLAKGKSPVVAPNACKCGQRKGKVVPGKVDSSAKPWKACNGHSKG